MTKRALKQALSAWLLFLNITQALDAKAQVVSKTPNLQSNAVVIQNVEPYKVPAGYPEDLLDWYADNIDSRSYVVIDVETNKILAQQDANVAYPIASMSKLMPAYLVYEAIEDGKLTMETKIEVPQEIEDHLSFNPELSSAFLEAGHEYTVEDLLNGVLLASGNDATSTLMWELYGNEQAAVTAIQDQLKEWGIENFQFYTTSGVPNQYIPEEWWYPGSNASSENTMAAEDVALMAQYVVDEHPEILEITSQESYFFAEGTDEEYIMSNPNELLPGRIHGREGINGLKSGMTDAAGRNFVATGTENGRKIIAVAMGIFPRADGLEVSSYWDIEILLDGLADHPDLYQLEGLASNLKPTLAEKKALEAELEASRLAEEADLAGQDETKQEVFENKRDSFLTNLMKRIFSIFQ